MRLALLLAAACLGLTGCATIRSWFAPSAPPAQAEQTDESARREARPPAPAAPRAAPPAPVAPRPPAPGPAPPPPAPDVSPPVLSPVPRAAPPAPVAPRPAAPGPAAPPPAPDVSPPVLSPVLSAVDEQRLRAETQQRVDGAEQRLRQIDPAKLTAGQQDSLRTVKSFLDKAREAVQAQDIQRAYTLADKAFLLADELTRRPR